MFKRFKHHLQEAKGRFSLSEDDVTVFLVGFLVILGPLLFVPIRGFAVSSSKGFIIVIIAVLGLLVYGVGALRKGLVSIPRKPVFIVLALIVGTGIIGAVLGSTFKTSFFGYGFETTTWLFMALLALFTLFAYRAVASYERIGIMYGGIVSVFLVLTLFHIIRFFAGPTFATLGVLGTSTSSLIGSWTDLGIFFGFIAVFCATTLELAGLKTSFKWIVGSIGGVALAMLLFMNISIIWIVLGLVSLILALYLFSFAYWDTEAKTYKKEHRAPWFVLAVFVIAIAALFFGSYFNSLASRHNDITWNDVRPSVKMTAKVAGKSLAHNFATGYGPNSFSQVWSLVKPAELSGSNVLASEFSQGFGYVPTLIATNGVLGAILWITLFVFIGIALVRKTMRGFSNSIDRYFSILVGMGILYLGIMAWTYLPGAYLLVLFAVLVGVFTAMTSKGDTKADSNFSFIKDPRASFFGILGITVLIVATLFGGYIIIRKMNSFVHYVRGTVLLGQNNFQGANKEITLAARLASHDIYHQQLTNFALSDVAQISGAVNESNKEAVSKQVEQILGTALGHAQTATTLNPSNYRNWVLLGNTYRSMVELGVTDAYERSKNAYQEAKNRVPHDTTMDLYFAQLEVSNKNIEKAFSIIKGSINAFPTAEAYILMAQIELGQQKNGDALESIKAAVGLAPYNAELTYQYGLLLFGQKRYPEAIIAFQRTILLNRNYALAYVYLGVSYEKAGDTKNAETIYDYIKKQFTDGAEAIAKLKSGMVETPSPALPDSVSKATEKSSKNVSSTKTSSKTPVAEVPKKQ